MLKSGHCIRYRATGSHKVTGPELTAGVQSVQYNKLILGLTLTLTINDTGGAVLTLMLGYRNLKLRLALTLTLVLYLLQ